MAADARLQELMPEGCLNRLYRSASDSRVACSFISFFRKADCIIVIIMSGSRILNQYLNSAKKLFVAYFEVAQYLESDTRGSTKVSAKS